MTNFERGAIVLVPFPYTDQDARYRRPTLIVSARRLGTSLHPLAWVPMITSAENRAWPGDVAVGDLSGTGLLDPSVVRTAKITTVELRGAERIGRLTAPAILEVEAQLRSILGFEHP